MKSTAVTRFSPAAKKSSWLTRAHNLVLNPIDLTRPNKPEMEGPKTAHEEAVMMRKLYQEMVLKTAARHQGSRQAGADSGPEPQEAGDCRSRAVCV